MQSHNEQTSFSIVESTGTVTLMIKFMRNKLSPDLHQKVADAIASCEACRALYEEVSDFFDEEKLELYRAENASKLRYAKTIVTSLIESHQPPKVPTNKMSPIPPIPAEVTEEDCFFCGA